MRWKERELTPEDMKLVVTARETLEPLITKLQEAINKLIGPDAETRMQAEIGLCYSCKVPVIVKITFEDVAHLDEDEHDKEQNAPSTFNVH